MRVFWGCVRMGGACTACVRVTQVQLPGLGATIRLGSCLQWGLSVDVPGRLYRHWHWCDIRGTRAQRVGDCGRRDGAAYHSVVATAVSCGGGGLLGARAAGEWACAVRRCGFIRSLLCKPAVIQNQPGRSELSKSSDRIDC